MREALSKADEAIEDLLDFEENGENNGNALSYEDVWMAAEETRIPSIKALGLCKAKQALNP